VGHRPAVVRGGTPANLFIVNQLRAPIDFKPLAPEPFHPGLATRATFGDPVFYLIEHGYTQLTTYQPANRFWAFQ
jgi:hypothetical protein